MANPKRNSKLSARSLLIVAAFSAVWCGIIGRLVWLQIFNHDTYLTKVIDNVQTETTVSAQRGVIYDRNMTQLATNTTVWRVFISPRDIKDEAQKQLIANGLSEILGADYNTIIEKANKTTRADETIKRDVYEEDADKVLDFISENDLDSQIHLEASTKRYYPYGSLAAQVIGLCGTDGGLLGLELQYDTELTGVPGRYITAKNAHGKRMPFKYDTYIEAQNGANVVTTIDVNIQNMLETQLEATYNDSEPLNRVTGIVMDVNTGAILGMGTYPSFDLNDPYTLDETSQAKLDASGYSESSDEYNTFYWELLYSMWKNKAVSELYEPGSTMKIITTAMAFEEGVVDKDEEFTCTGSFYISGYDQPIHCHKLAGHGTHPYYYMLQQSCNPTLMTVAARIGRQKFYEYFQEFGYTEKTGIDLPGEADSIYHAYSGFNQVELAVYSFGQTFKVTALQQLTAICAVANGGYLVTPHVVSSLVDDDGNVIKTYETEIKRQVVSTDVCKEISAILEDGVSGDGGAKNAYVAGYKIAAKTGTSEVRDVLDADGNSYLRVGSCVAYAPSDDPQIAVIIVVDEPQSGSVYGSVVAAPYVANLMNELLPDLGIERSYSEEELAKLSVQVSNYVGWPLADAISVVTNNGLEYEVVGSSADGAVISYQIPSSGSTLQKNTGRVIFYTGNATADDYVEVPNVVGYSATTANRLISNAGFNIMIDGAQNYDIGAGAVVVSQTPAAGEQALYGSVVTITMRYMDGTAN